MKFGGTSVADAERLKRAARRIVAAREQGRRVVAVLSARGKTTDELISMAEEVSSTPDPREMDMLLSTGERISCARTIRPAARLIRSASATEVPPNFITIVWPSGADIAKTIVRVAVA